MSGSNIIGMILCYSSFITGGILIVKVMLLAKVLYKRFLVYVSNKKCKFILQQR